MEQNRFFKLASAFLLIINILLLVFLYFGRRSKPNPSRSLLPEAIRILDLDERQEADFKLLASEHNKQLGRISKEKSELISLHFEKLKDPSLADEEMSPPRRIQELEGEKILVTYAHFQDVKALLRQDQLSNFDTFLEKATKILITNNRRPRPLKRK